jgi:hypothetical protein
MRCFRKGFILSRRRTISTRRWRLSSISPFMCTSEKGSGVLVVMQMSMSLSSRNSPRATEPKTQREIIPYFSAYLLLKSRKKDMMSSRFIVRPAASSLCYHNCYWNLSSVDRQPVSTSQTSPLPRVASERWEKSTCRSCMDHFIFPEGRSLSGGGGVGCSGVVGVSVKGDTTGFLPSALGFTFPVDMGGSG